MGLLSQAGNLQRLAGNCPPCAAEIARGLSAALEDPYRRYLKVEGSGHFVIDEKQVKAEERYDGIWVLRTNTVYDMGTVAHVYKALWTVEDIIRTSKSILETESHLPQAR